VGDGVLGAEGHSLEDFAHEKGIHLHGTVARHLVGDEVLGAEGGGGAPPPAVQRPLPGVECHHQRQVVALGVGDRRQQRRLGRLRSRVVSARVSNT
jgi:hypothetical protein